MTDAEYCRQQGWGPGTILEGRNGATSEDVRIRITAIGDSLVLAAIQARRPHGSDVPWVAAVNPVEAPWLMRDRGWVAVFSAPASPPPTPAEIPAGDDVQHVYILVAVLQRGETHEGELRMAHQVATMFLAAPDAEAAELAGTRLFHEESWVRDRGYAVRLVEVVRRPICRAEHFLDVPDDDAGEAADGD